MGFPRRRQFAHLQLATFLTTRQTIIAADATLERMLDFLSIEITDSQAADWGFLLELSDTGAANHRKVGESELVLSASTDTRIWQMAQRVSVGDAVVQQAKNIGIQAGKIFLPELLLIPAGAELTFARLGGNSDTGLVDVIGSGIEEGIG